MNYTLNTVASYSIYLSNTCNHTEIGALDEHLLSAQEMLKGFPVLASARDPGDAKKGRDQKPFFFHLSDSIP